MTAKRERLVLPSGRLVFIETLRGPRYDLVTYRPGRARRPKAKTDVRGRMSEVRERKGGAA